jgi:hypothetical protein
MANKYLDHYLYATNASFTGSVSSTTLTVSSVTSGVIGIGSALTGVGVPAGTFITSLGTGQGGTGTYNLNNSFTLSSTTLTSTNGNPSIAMPAWGVAQDGDGLAPGQATPALASLTINAVAAAGNTITIAGVTLTAVSSGATATQFNVGSDVNAQATNIATALNAATGAVGANVSATLTQLRNIIFASASGSVVNIMTRQGSVNSNYANNSYMAISSSGWSTAPTVVQFAGGTSGAWGWLFNTYVMWPSAIAVANYGLFGATQPFLGAVSPGDNIYVRSNKILYCYNANYYLTPPTTFSTAALPTNIIFDDGTNVPAWNADAPDPVFRVNWASDTNLANSLSLIAHKATRIVGKVNSTGLPNLQFHNTNSAITNGTYFAWTFSNNCYAKGVGFYNDYQSNTGIYAQLAVSNSADAGAGVMFDDIFMSFSNTSNNIYDLGNAYCSGTIRNLVFDNSGATAPHTGLINCVSANNDLVINGIKAINCLVGSKSVKSSSGIGAGNILIINADLGNAFAFDPIASMYGNGNNNTLYRTVSIFSSAVTRDFQINTIRGKSDWISGLGFPTLSATLLDGVTPWSIKFLASIIPGQTSTGRPHSSPRISKINSLANGARTITLEYLLNDTLSGIDTSNLWAELTYTDTNGRAVYLTTRQIFPAAALTPSTNTGWSTWNGTKATWISGGTINFDRYKFVLSTPAGHDMTSGCEIIAQVHIGTSVTNVQQVLFIDPDMSLA